MSDQRELELREEIMQMDYIGITKRIAELEAESQKLRVEAAVTLQTVQALNAKENHLLYENQRLREALTYVEKNTGQRFIEQAAQRALGGGE